MLSNNFLRSTSGGRYGGARLTQPLSIPEIATNLSIDGSAEEEEEEEEEIDPFTEEADDGSKASVEVDVKALRKVKLPRKIILIDNPDKAFHEKWHKGRSKLNIPHPFRCIAFGPPNVGKSTIVKNILLRAKPQFEEVFIIHCDIDYTQEYDDIMGAQMLDEIPDPRDWVGEVKTLVVLEDLEYKQMSKQQKRALDRLYGYVSTHKNISAIMCSQDCFNIPASVRRCSNFYILWRTPDMDSMATIARRTGLTKKIIMNIFDNLLPEFHDSLWIDLTSGTKNKLRKNGFQTIRAK